MKEIWKRIWADVKRFWPIPLGVGFLYVVLKKLHGAFCPMVIIFGLPCPGCGTTRAASNFFHMNFDKAIEYNEIMALTLLPAYFFFLVTEVIWYLYNKIFKKQSLSPLGYLVELISIKL